MVQYLMAYLNARQDEEGQGLVEYALILALVAVIVATALIALEGEITSTFGDVVAALA